MVVQSETIFNVCFLVGSIGIHGMLRLVLDCSRDAQD